MKRIYIVLLVVATIIQTSCTESIEIETIDYESVLVVESTITNELKPQLVKLSRTSPLNEPGGFKEHNATVTVSGSDGTLFSFSEEGTTGDYYSNAAFQAVPGVSYTLEIDTQSGEKYTSSEVVIAPAVAMDNVYTELITKDGEQGISVFVDTQDPTGNAKYFRYEYEETYKVVAPFPSSLTISIENFNAQTGTYDVVTSPREPEEVCYSTEFSTGIIQTSTTELTDNQVLRFPVRFIPADNSVLRSRYSILVKQYTQSIEAATFYKIINELGSVESLLSQGQPGYVPGNISAVGDPSKKVIGFFEASSFTSERIYFNYEDFGLEIPPFFIECDYLILDYRDNTALDNDPNERDVLRTYVNFFDYQLVVSNDPFYHIAKIECTVCTSFSSNVRPDFWTD
ncbi:DUF4249 domain-containing protein [Ulvibacter litoralis]|uniref:DUF4249 domain-containing protein n=1 Tax=Ulvibacter litoralis TaxID=227084 RepID=A0A1G7F7A8_9FLAO|nr:DUF4249 domain-containing protein [Ulvibacter litoralis]GHC52336.1 hypothetical protein GCM10008083_15200 [Ulvibacter litoralis]SDE71820.1 protein of unknown function [Ulvibacter litoralis]